MHWTEDSVAVVTGVLILAFSLVVFVILPYEAITQADGGNPLVAQTNAFTAHLDLMTAKLQKWEHNPLHAFSGKNHIMGLISIFMLLAVLMGGGVKILKTPFLTFVKGFVVVFSVGLLAYLLAAQVDFKFIGFSYALWAIVLGIFISNTFGLPDWLKPALRHELLIKTGLVLLGAEVLFGKILAIGIPGIFVAWVVTPIVLVATFWFGQRVLKITSKSLNITISADMSVCGVSAAIATAAACKAKKEELTTAIGLSMVFTSVMMVALPTLIKAVGMPEVLGGAWLGGTIDATGAVVAAGAFLGETAMNVAATIKMIQNILIGVIAFAVAIYWTAKVDKTPGQPVSAKEIWTRFPKFILGFIGASICFSILQQSLNPELSQVLIEQELFGFTKGIRGWLFCLAFVSIGLSTNFKELKEQFSGGKPLMLYVCGQLFNLGLTLLMAWLMFYVIFPEITEKI